MPRKRTRASLTKEDPPFGMPGEVYFYRRRGRREHKKIKGQFTNVRMKFLAHLLENHEQELKYAGLKKDDLQRMEQGLVPEGYVVHHMEPLEAQGTNDFSNLILIKNDPYHKGIHAYLDGQLHGLKVSQGRRVMLPRPKGPVFIPDMEPALEAELQDQPTFTSVRKALLQSAKDAEKAGTKTGKAPSKAKPLEATGQEADPDPFTQATGMRLRAWRKDEAKAADTPLSQPAGTAPAARPGPAP